MSIATRFISKDTNTCSAISSWLTTAELCSGSIATVVRSLSKQEHKTKLIIAPNEKHPLDLLGFSLNAQRNRGNKKTIMSGNEPRVNANKVNHSAARVSFSRKNDFHCYTPPERKETPADIKMWKFHAAEDPIGYHEKEAAKPMFSALFATLRESDIRKKELKPVKSKFWKTFHESHVRKQLPAFKPQWNVLYSTLENAAKRRERLANCHNALIKILATSNERREQDAAIMKNQPHGKGVKQKKLSKTIRRKKSSKEDGSKENPSKPTFVYANKVPMAVPVSPSALNTSAGEDGAYCSDSSIGQSGLFFQPVARVRMGAIGSVRKNK